MDHGLRCRRHRLNDAASTLWGYVPDRNGGVADWTYREITIGTLNHTVVPGRQLRLRLMFGLEDMWVGLSGDRATRLVLSQP